MDLINGVSPDPLIAAIVGTCAWHHRIARTSRNAHTVSAHSACGCEFAVIFVVEVQRSGVESTLPPQDIPDPHPRKTIALPDHLVRITPTPLYATISLN
jgi:formylmethanofuran:tetrahydromethanopterin formyltransferase